MCKKRITFLIFFILLTGLTHKLICQTNNPENNQVKVALVGDIYLGGHIQKLTKKYGYDYPFKKVMSILKEADIVFGNLESPLSIKGNPTKNMDAVRNKKDYLLRASSDMVNSLKIAGFTIVSLANNHAMDYGEEALIDTINNLETNGIKVVGAGKNIYVARSPRVITVKNIKIGFLAYSVILPYKSPASINKPGINPGRGSNKNYLDTYISKVISSDVKKAKSMSDFLIISVHWGKESTHNLNSIQKNLAHFLIDNDADLVVGHHPHILQETEKYKDKLIFYSLGNFVFRSSIKYANESIIVLVTINENRTSIIKTIPVHIRNGIPEISNKIGTIPNE